MAKAKSFYFCQECGYQSSSWLGKCPECGKWNTFVEEVVEAAPVKASRGAGGQSPVSMPKLIRDVTYSETVRIPTHCAEFDRVLGGGLFRGRSC